MTLDEKLTALENPYLDEYLELTGGRRREPAWNEPWDPVAYDITRSPWVRRFEFCEKYAWAIPDTRAIEMIASLGPIVEMGAGGGYWAWLLRQAGADVIAYDIAPGENHWVKKLWTEVETGAPVNVRKHADRTLFLCWPPYSDPMASLTLRYYLQAGGENVVYVGEDWGGCTGDDKFHDLLKKRFVHREDHEDDFHSIPAWWGIRDYLWVHRRKVRA